MKYKKTSFVGVREFLNSKDTYQVRYRDHIGRDVSLHITAKSAGEAQAYRKAAITKAKQIRNGVLPAPESVRKVNYTFADIWELYDAHRRHHLKIGKLSTGAYKRPRDSYNALKSTCPGVVNKKITNLNENTLDTFIEQRQTQNRSAYTINGDIVRLKAVSNWAVKKDLIARDPFIMVEKLHLPNLEVRYLDQKEMGRLRTVLDSIHKRILSKEDDSKGSDLRWDRDAHDLIIFYLNTAARATEALPPKLIWENVRLPKTVKLNTKGGKIRIADVVNMPECISMLKRRKRYAEDAPFAGLSYKMVVNRIRDVIKRAKIKDFTIHDIRRTAGAYYLMITRDLVATAEFLGHTDTKVTYNHYVTIMAEIRKNYNREYGKVITEGYRKFS